MSADHPVEHPFPESLLEERERRRRGARPVDYCSFCGARLEVMGECVLFTSEALDSEAREYESKVWNAHAAHFEEALHPDHRETGLTHSQRQARIEQALPLARECCFCSAELETPHAFIVETVWGLYGQQTERVWCAHRECLSQALHPEMRKMRDSRDARTWEETDAELDLKRIVSFKLEDEVDGEPIGPVWLIDWERAVISDYGWMSLREEKKLARSLGVELEEDG